MKMVQINLQDRNKVTAVKKQNKTKLMVTRESGEWGAKDKLETGVNIYTLLYLN